MQEKRLYRSGLKASAKPNELNGLFPVICRHWVSPPHPAATPRHDGREKTTNRKAQIRRRGCLKDSLFFCASHGDWRSSSCYYIMLKRATGSRHSGMLMASRCAQFLISARNPREHGTRVTKSARRFSSPPQCAPVPPRKADSLPTSSNSRPTAPRYWLPRLPT